MGLNSGGSEGKQQQNVINCRPEACGDMDIKDNKKRPAAAGATIEQPATKRKEDVFLCGGIEMGRMRNSAALAAAGGWNDLRERFAADGFVFLKGYLPKAEAKAARSAILTALAGESPHLFQPGSEPVEGRLVARTAAIGLLSRQEIANLAAALALFEHKRLVALASALLNGGDTPSAAAVQTSEFKWLRAVGKNEFTGPHTDRVYLGGCSDFATFWLPLGDIGPELGGMAVASRSNHSALRESYSKRCAVGADGTTSGYLSPSVCDAAVRNLDWRTGRYCPGDVVAIGPDTLHSTVPNLLDYVRLSCDTRWLATGVPAPARSGAWRVLQARS